MIQTIQERAGAGGHHLRQRAFLRAETPGAMSSWSQGGAPAGAALGTPGLLSGQLGHSPGISSVGFFQDILLSSAPLLG